MSTIRSRPTPSIPALSDRAIRLGSGLCLGVLSLAAGRLFLDSTGRIWAHRSFWLYLLKQMAWTPICFAHASGGAQDPRWLQNLGMWSGMVLLTLSPSVKPAWRALSRARPVSAYEILSGYCAPWLGLSVCAILLSEGMRRAALSTSATRWLIAALLIGVGAYHMSPWRERLRQAWRQAATADQTLDGNAERVGLRMGLACVGCNGPMMALIGAIGMNPTAMTASAILMAFECRSSKRWSSSPWISRSCGVALVIGGGVGLIRPDF